MHYNLVLVLAFVAVLVDGVPVTDNTKSTNSIYSSIAKCASEQGPIGIINCAAVRVLRSLEIANAEQTLQVLPGVALIDNNPGLNRAAKKLDVDTLPSKPRDKTDKLFQMIMDAAIRLFSGKTLSVKLPSTSPENLARALEEGRGKMKKMMNPLMLGFGATMVTMVPLLLGGVTMMAAKALMVGKMAFVVSLVLFAQYFFNRPTTGGGSFFGTSGYPVYGAPSPSYGTNNIGGWSQQYPYKRSLNIYDNEEVQASTSAQDLAYSGQN